MQENSHLSLGLMSGTSCDGVDVALIRTDGEGSVEPVRSSFRPYSDREQALFKQAMQDAAGMDDREARPGCLAEAEDLVTKVHIEAAQAFISKLSQDQKPEVIGFHGQTVWHDPSRGITVQLGDGRALAKTLGLNVVYDMRAADIAAGGQGAPLVPIYHRALQASSSMPPPCAVINIGGVANITWIDEAGALTAFDSGPGNALINDLVLRTCGRSMDEGGRIAASGTVDYLALIALMGNPYFRKTAPKSLDRNAFDIEPIAHLSLEDAAATLTAFTVETLCLGLEQAEQLSGKSAELAVVCGGGQHNVHMMAQLADALDCPVKLAKDLGWDGDAIEAQAFAYLAVRCLKGLPITFPGTTGVKSPITGGVIAKA